MRKGYGEATNLVKGVEGPLDVGLGVGRALARGHERQELAEIDKAVLVLVNLSNGSTRPSAHATAPMCSRPGVPA